VQQRKLVKPRNESKLSLARKPETQKNLNKPTKQKAKQDLECLRTVDTYGNVSW